MGIGEDEDTAGEMFAWEVEGSSGKSLQFQL